jgi:Bacterial regulatory helix-turn-helix protein, lysR family
MLDGVSLDQLRTFLAAADEGSFSAAGRRLRRAQSVVSQSLANLEGQLGVKLFDRSGHLPVLTDQGRALLANARAVAGDVDLLKARAKNLAGGLKPELSVAADVMFPDATFTHAVAAFQKSRPNYPKSWRLSHLGAKLAFLRAGLGFGSMPLHTIEADGSDRQPAERRKDAAGGRRGAPVASQRPGRKT